MTSEPKPDETSDAPKIVVGDGSKKSLRRPPVKVVLAVILAVLLVGGLSWAAYQYFSPDKVAQNQCTKKSNSNVEAASFVLDPSQNERLKPLVEKIKQTCDYDKDPDHLYILVVYHTNISDPTTARKYLTTLQSINESNPPASILLEKGDLSYLNTRLELAERQMEQIRKNFTGFGEEDAESGQ